MRRISLVGVAVTVVILAGLVAFPYVFQANWVVNIAVFTMMYAGLATAWNLLGGYSGYISLEMEGKEHADTAVPKSIEALSRIVAVEEVPPFGK